jgi:lipoprotein-anchoring transpeptidase ErfK/SrfK
VTAKAVSRCVVVLFGAVLALAAATPFTATAVSEEMAHAAAGGRRIVVSSRQTLYAYSGNTLVFSAPVNARGTRGGTFRVQNKIAQAGSIVRGWKLPYWLGLYYVGRVQNGIHGPAITRNGAATTSLGCVVLRRTADAAWLFRWAAVGTPVTVRR